MRSTFRVAGCLLLLISTLSVFVPLVSAFAASAAPVPLLESLAFQANPCKLNPEKCE